MSGLCQELRNLLSYLTSPPLNQMNAATFWHPAFKIGERINIEKNLRGKHKI